MNKAEEGQLQTAYYNVGLKVNKELTALCTVMILFRVKKRLLKGCNMSGGKKSTENEVK